MALGPGLVRRLERAVARYGRGVPVTAAELAEVGARLGLVVDPDYADFVGRFGGCYVGVSVYGIRNSSLLGNTTVTELTLGFREGGHEGIERSLVFSMDLSGNPITIDPDGRVRLHDHEFGGVHEEAPGFAALLERHVDDSV